MSLRRFTIKLKKRPQRPALIREASIHSGPVTQSASPTTTLAKAPVAHGNVEDSWRADWKLTAFATCMMLLLVGGIVLLANYYREHQDASVKAPQVFSVSPANSNPGAALRRSPAFRPGANSTSNSGSYADYSVQTEESFLRTFGGRSRIVLPPDVDGDCTIANGGKSLGDCLAQHGARNE